MNFLNILIIRIKYNLYFPCSGQVELVTADGDRLNLKSKLCQLVSLSTIFESASTIPEMEIIAHEAEDSRKIMDYLMRG